jgi:hypothetical protein
MGTVDNQEQIGELPSRHDICPGCQSADWKSARMVIMEGTSSTAASVEGNVTDRGAFSGGFREFLLSDRWFSWDYSVNAGVTFNTSTGLVEEIKALMVKFGENLKIPAEPIKPLKPQIPCPSEPIKPLIPSGLSHLRDSLLIAGVLFAGPFWLFAEMDVPEGDNAKLIMTSAILIVPTIIFFLIAEFIASGRRGVYAMRLKLYEEKSEVYESVMRTYRRKMTHWNDENPAKWRIEKERILRQREELWESARVCMRCGTAYFSKSV